MAGSLINFKFDCPVCGGRKTLKLKNISLKGHIECSICGSKFEQKFMSDKYKLVKGDSEYFGKELSMSEWGKISKNLIFEIEKTKISENNKLFNEDMNERICGIFAVSKITKTGISKYILVNTTNRIIIITSRLNIFERFFGWFFITSIIVKTFLIEPRRNNLRCRLTELKSEDIIGLRVFLNSNKYIEYLNDDIEKIKLNDGKRFGFTTITIHPKDGKIEGYMLDETIPFKNVNHLLSLSLSNKIIIE